MSPQSFCRKGRAELVNIRNNDGFATHHDEYYHGAKEKARKCDELEANYGDDKSVESKCRSSFDTDAAVLNDDCATVNSSRTTTESPRSLSVALSDEAHQQSNGSQSYELCHRARAIDVKSKSEPIVARKLAEPHAKTTNRLSASKSTMALSNSK